MIVICGFGRSGTTLLYSMLRATVTNYKTYDREMPYTKGEANSVTKRPLDILTAPDSIDKIIMIRDVRSVITSVHSGYPNQYFSSGDKYITGQPGIIPAWHAIKSTSGYILKYEDLVDDPDLVQAKTGERFGFTYEGFFSDFHKSDIAANLRKPLNGIRPVDSGHDWRMHMDRVIGQFERFPELHDILIDTGYEKDRSWSQF